MTDTNKAEMFKTKGTSILRPQNMEDFINGSQNTQIHKTTNAQNHNSDIGNGNGPRKSDTHEKLGRLHIQLRQDLIDRLLDAVFKRKRAPGTTKRTASQRAIIEEALEQYFTTDET